MTPEVGDKSAGRSPTRLESMAHPESLLSKKRPCDLRSLLLGRLWPRLYPGWPLGLLSALLSIPEYKAGHGTYLPGKEAHRGGVEGGKQSFWGGQHVDR